MGAMDVCPFIPVQDATMEDCVECAKEFGERLSVELGVPGEFIILIYLSSCLGLVSLTLNSFSHSNRNNKSCTVVL